MYQLLFGNIFDKECDLLIIPCNTNGGVTSSVERELRARKLHLPRKEFIPGDVYFTRSSAVYTNAKRIGYAASVSAHENRSYPEFLEKISEQIIRYCEEQNLHQVVIPLLGSGAGGMMSEEAFAVLKRKFEHHNSIMVNICVLSRSVYERLNTDTTDTLVTVQNTKVYGTVSEKERLKIFIGSSSERIDNMKQIACWLETFGCIPYLWTDAEVFPLGTYTWDALIAASKKVDGAIFIFGADDKAWFRDETRMSVRDNVLLEYGLFCGALSRERVIFVCAGKPSIASDLLGITYAGLDKPHNLENSLKKWVEHIRNRK